MLREAIKDNALRTAFVGVPLGILIGAGYIVAYDLFVQNIDFRTLSSVKFDALAPFGLEITPPFKIAPMDLVNPPLVGSVLGASVLSIGLYLLYEHRRENKQHA